MGTGHSRLINTGPWTVVGGHFRNWHHDLNEDMPPQSGLDLYSFSKGLGHEIARVYTENNPLHVMTTMHGSFPRADWDVEYPLEKEGSASMIPGDYPFQPLSSTFADAAVRFLKTSMIFFNRKLQKARPQNSLLHL